MKLDKLVSRLSREITAHPKKAAALGLLVVVAVWFWVPLVWGWMSPRQVGAPNAATPAATSTTPGAGQSVVVATSDDQKRGADKHAWKEIAQWIQSDPRMAVATDLPGRPDPFDPVKPSASDLAGSADEQKEKEAAAAVALSGLDPESLGLTLSSTIVGSRGGTALINGKSYRLGATVRADHEGRSVDFQLTAIHADSVVLRKGEKDYEIRLPEPATAGQVEIMILNDD